MYDPSSLQMLKITAIAIQTLFIFQAVLTIEHQWRLLSGYFPPPADLATSMLKLQLEKGVKKANRFTAGKKRFIKLFLRNSIFYMVEFILNFFYQGKFDVIYTLLKILKPFLMWPNAQQSGKASFWKK